MNTISILAGIGAIVLIIELLLVTLVVGAAVYFLRRGLIVGQQRAAPYVELVTAYVQRTEELTSQYSQLIVSPQVGAISTLRGLQRAWRALIQHD